MTTSHESHVPDRQPGVERRLKLSLGGVRDYAIVMLDPDGRVETWNLGAQMIAGYLADEIVGRSIDTLFTSEDRSAGKPGRLLADARATGRAEAEGWQIRKDG